MKKFMRLDSAYVYFGTTRNTHVGIQKIQECTLVILCKRFWNTEDELSEIKDQKINLYEFCISRIRYSHESCSSDMAHNKMKDDKNLCHLGWRFVSFFVAFLERDFSFFSTDFDTLESVKIIFDVFRSDSRKKSNVSIFDSSLFFLLVLIMWMIINYRPRDGVTEKSARDLVFNGTNRSTSTLETDQKRKRN